MVIWSARAGSTHNSHVQSNFCPTHFQNLDAIPAIVARFVRLRRRYIGSFASPQLRATPPCGPPPISAFLALVGQVLKKFAFTILICIKCIMFSYFYAFWALVACNCLVFSAALYAHARVRANEKALEALDWETLANLTGEVGAIKRSLQKVNNRINGMTASDPTQILAELPQLQTVTQQNGRIGG